MAEAEFLSDFEAPLSPEASAVTEAEEPLSNWEAARKTLVAVSLEMRWGMKEGLQRLGRAWFKA